MPRLKSGKYNEKVCVRWVRDKDRTEAKRSVKPAKYDEAKARKMAAEAEISEYSLMERRGELLTVTQFEEAVADGYGMIRARLMTMSARLAPELVGVKTQRAARTIVKRVVGEIMTEISEL